MLRQHDAKLRALLLITDVFLCAGVFWLLCLAGELSSGGNLGTAHPLSLVALTLLASTALPVSVRMLAHDPSSRLEPLSSAARNLLRAAAVSAVILAAGAFLADAQLGPGRLLACVGLQLVGVGLVRLSALEALRVLRRRGRNFRNVVVIGTGPRAVDLSETVERHSEWGLKLVAYVDEGDTPYDERIPQDRVFKLVDFPQLLCDEVVDEVITACPRSMLATIGAVVEVCSASGVPLTVMTDLFGEFMPAPRMKRFATREGLMFAPVHHNRTKLYVKRGIDVAGATLGLLVMGPVMAAAALAIKLTSPGPIFFRQIRCGLNGRPFMMLKLRTMVSDAEDLKSELLHLNEMDGPVFKMEADPRITSVGRMLRAFSIDELPQFWNVLVGDMSLVGPRPPIPAEVVQYETSERRRLSMRPGLTCLWQISGRNSISFEDWVKLDLQYIDSWSLSNDFRILAQTLPSILGGTGH